MKKEQKSFELLGNKISGAVIAYYKPCDDCKPDYDYEYENTKHDWHTVVHYTFWSKKIDGSGKRYKVDRLAIVCRGKAIIAGPHSDVINDLAFAGANKAVKDVQAYITSSSIDSSNQGFPLIIGVADHNH